MKKLPEGWSEGTIQDFLELTDEEMAEIEDRVDGEAALKALANGDFVSAEEVQLELGLVWHDEAKEALKPDDD